MTLGGLVFFVVVAVLIGFAILTYNRLVGLRQRSEEAWSGNSASRRPQRTTCSLSQWSGVTRRIACARPK